MTKTTCPHCGVSWAGTGPLECYEYSNLDLIGNRRRPSCYHRELALWKDLAAKLAESLKLTKERWTFSSGQVHTHTWHDWADCIGPVTESLTAYNNLKNPTK
jgi:hypothetical protein